jgi:hypothetical protein
LAHAPIPVSVRTPVARPGLINADRWVAIGLCLLGGIAVGVSGFSSDSNHPTYLPPMLHYLDAGYLAKDWWLASARHYHFAFFAITAVLARFGILEVGLAALNVLTVAGALYACFLIVADVVRSRRIAILAVFVALFLATRSFYSVGASYLFTPSLQASSLAATATLVAMLYLLRRRLVACGLWLAVAGLAHVNFLVVNLPFFAAAWLLTVAQEPALRGDVRRIATNLLVLLGPSLLLLAAFAPLLLDIGAQPLSPSQARMADWIFFRFAVPFHYDPRTYLDRFYPFLCWQGLGLLWTRHAIADPARRRVAYAMQIALALVIGSATALTTIVFVPAISRLFVWRLAPFAELFAALMIVIGAVRATGRDEAESGRPGCLLLACSIALLPVLMLPPADPDGQIVSTHGLWPAALMLAVVFAWAGLRRATGWHVFPRGWPTAAALAALLLAAFLVQPSDGMQSRYSLLVSSPDRVEQRDLFAFIRRTTPRDAMFLTPPDLNAFRLEAERATVVDIKAMPINRGGLTAWYRRLAAVSGDPRPAGMNDVIAGYAALDAARIAQLRRTYYIAYIVTRADRPVAADGWTQIFRNGGYRLFAYRPR